MLLSASPTLVGTPFDDNDISGYPAIYGTMDNDIIDGLAGDDYVYGDGNVSGASGNDIIVGGDGRDLLFGEEGDDWLEPGPMPQPVLANQTVDGGNGLDILFLLGAPTSYQFYEYTDGGFIADASYPGAPEGQVAAYDIELVAFGVSALDYADGTAQPLALVDVSQLVGWGADRAAIAVADTIVGARGASEILIALPQILGNDIDLDGDLFDIVELLGAPGVNVAGFDASPTSVLPDVPSEYAFDFPDGLVRVQLDAPLTAPVTFGYRLADASSGLVRGNVATVTLQPSQPPTATDDTLRATLGQDNYFDVAALLANDSEGLTFRGIVPGSFIQGDNVAVEDYGSSVRVASFGTTPTSVSFAYEAEDAFGNVATANVTVEVFNHAPVVADGAAVVSPGGTYTLRFADLAAFPGTFDPNGDALAMAFYALAVPPTVTLMGFEDRIEFAFADDYAGDYVLDFALADVTGGQDAGRFRFLTTMPAAPVAVADTLRWGMSTTPGEAFGTFSLTRLLANDVLAPGVKVYGDFTTVAQPANGVFYVEPGNPNSVVPTTDPLNLMLSYLPRAGFTGIDTVTYAIVDELGRRSTTTLTFDVSVPKPVVPDTTITLPPGATSVTFPASALLANATLTGTGKLSGYAIRFDADSGVLQASADPATGLYTSFTYTPDANTVLGQDAFFVGVIDQGAEGGSARGSTFVRFVGAPPPSIALASADAGSAVEGNAVNTLNNGALTFVIRRSGDLSLGSTVDFTLDAAPGSTLTVDDVGMVAEGGNNLRSGLGSFTAVFAPGQETETVYVFATGDVVAEADEAVRLTLTGGSGATLSATGLLSATGRFINDDLPVVEGSPVAQADHYTVRQGRTLTIPAPGLLANDSDPNGDAIQAINYVNPSHGTVSIVTDGSFVYTPTAGFAGTDSFDYIISDGVNTARATVTIDVTNTAPVASADSYSVVEGRTLTIPAPGLLANDTDADGDAIQAINFFNASHGTVSIVTDGSFVYTPTAGFTGTDTFNYIISDGAGTSQATVTINVIEGSPIAQADHYSVHQGKTLTIPAPGLLSNDSDPNGDAIQAINYFNPSHGTVSIVTDGSFVYTPAAGFAGTDTFDYIISDGVNTAQATVTIDVTNTAPVANADSYTTAAGVALTIPAPGLLANDTDADGDAIQAINFFNPAHGTVSIVTDGSFVYTPTAGFTGTDTFDYIISDGAGTSQATVTIRVTGGNGPVAGADAFFVRHDRTLTVAGADVLANDSDADGDTLAVAQYLAAAHGTVVRQADGGFTYTPEARFVGRDTFEYVLEAGGERTRGTITIDVTNDAPVASYNEYTVHAGRVLNVGAPGVFVNDSDADGDPLTVIGVDDAGLAGTVVFGTGGAFAFTPTAGFIGSTSFVYEISDAFGGSDTAEVAIFVTNTAPDAVDDTYWLHPGATLDVALPGVLGNDRDADGDAIVVRSIDITGAAGLSTVAQRPDGSLRVTAAPGFTGVSRFTYTIVDAFGATDTATVTVNVGNAAPVAVDDRFRVLTGGVLDIAAPGLLANDTDVERDALSVTLASVTGLRGTLVPYADGRFRFTAQAGFVGETSFGYTVTDGHGGFDSGTVIIEVYNNGPVAVDDHYVARPGRTLDIAAPGLLANDSDADGDGLTITLANVTGLNGSLVPYADGHFRFTPQPGFTGATAFSYTVSDGRGGYDSATVSIDVVNSAPVGNDDEYSVHVGNVLDIAAPGLLANDTDADGDALGVTLANVSGLQGTLVPYADGRFRFTPKAGFTGDTSFSYTISDGFGGYDTATATIHVRNAAPVATDDTYTVRANRTLDIAVPGLLVNDSDADGDALNVTLANVTGLQGTVVPYADGHFRFTPTAGFTGQTSFTYTIGDGHGGFDTGVVTIDVVNRPPVVVNDIYSIHAGDVLDVSVPGLLGNDTDADGDALAITLANVTGLRGSLVPYADGHFRFSPETGFSGTTGFTYTVTDGYGAFVTGTVSIDVTNTSPTVVGESYVVRSGQVLTVAAPGLLGNDVDADGDVLSIARVDTARLAGKGSVTFAPEGRFTFTPLAGFTGVADFGYTVTDGNGAFVDALVSIEVVAANTNRAPVAGDDAYSVHAGQALTVPVPGILGNDSDPDGDPLRVAVVNITGLRGTLTPFVDGHFTFTASPGFVGDTSFTYSVSDGLGGFDTATVTLHVTNAAPQAVDNHYSMRANTSLSIPVATGLLSNDTDADGDTLRVSVVNITDLQGTLTPFIDGRFNFTPVAGFTGTTSFSYTVSDGLGGFDTAIVTIDVVNRAPIAVDDVYSVHAGQVLSIPTPGLLGNDTDADGDALNISVVNITGLQGTLTPYVDGRFNFTPNAGFVGTTSFTYTVRDGFGGFDTATVTLQVTNAAPVATDDHYVVRPTQTLSIPVGTGLLSNDTDADGDPLRVAVVNITDLHGTLTPYIDGRFNFTPAAGFTGTTGFTYTISDGMGGFDTGTVTIDVVNSAPVATDDVYTVHVGQLLAIPVPGLLGNDADLDGDPLQVSVVNITDLQGTITPYVDGRFNFTPGAGFTGVTSFRYTVSDGFGGYDTATVTINVVNAAPVARDDQYTMRANGTLTVALPGLLGNDSDTDGDAVHVAVVNISDLQGTITPYVDGRFSFTPIAGFVGTTGFTYTVSDGVGGVASATATINVVNSTPLFAPISDRIIRELDGLVVDADATDPDGDALTFRLVRAPEGASIDRATGLIRWAAPAVRPTEAVRFVVQVSDGTVEVEQAFHVQVLDLPLRVESLAATASGFDVRFNRPLDVGVFNVYESTPENLGPADLVLRGSSGASIRGSAVIDPDGQGLRFVKTGGPLVADTYTLHIRAAADGLADLAGRALDGDDDGLSGGDYAATFTVDPSADRVLSIADFARGPGQDVVVPNSAQGGLSLPVQLSEGTNVGSMSFDLRFDAALLDILAVEIVEGRQGTVVRSSIDGGERIEVRFDETLSAGPVKPLNLVVRVPSSATYGAAGVVSLDGVQLLDALGNPLAATGDAAVHVAAYFMDTSGNATYSMLDVQRLQRVAARLDTGFGAYPNVDPALIGDLNGNGQITSLDVTRLLQYVQGTSRPEIPALPAGTSPLVFTGPARNIGLAGSTSAAAGERVAVTLTMDDASGVESVTAKIVYDDTRLDYVGVRLLADFPYKLVKQTSGEIVIDLARANTFGVGAGDLLAIDFDVRNDAAGGPVLVDLQSLQINEGKLSASVPSQPGIDATDAQITVIAEVPASPESEVLVDGASTGTTGLLRKILAVLSDMQLSVIGAVPDRPSPPPIAEESVHAPRLPVMSATEHANPEVIRIDWTPPAAMAASDTTEDWKKAPWVKTLNQSLVQRGTPTPSPGGAEGKPSTFKSLLTAPLRR